MWLKALLLTTISSAETDPHMHIKRQNPLMSRNTYHKLVFRHVKTLPYGYQRYLHEKYTCAI